MILFFGVCRKEVMMKLYLCRTGITRPVVRRRWNGGLFSTHETDHPNADARLGHYGRVRSCHVNMKVVGSMDVCYYVYWWGPDSLGIIMKILHCNTALSFLS